MRCYNGCPDTELKKVIDAHDRARQAIEAAGYSVTWFPSGEFFMAFKDHKAVTREHRSIFAVAGELNVQIGEGS